MAKSAELRVKLAASIGGVNTIQNPSFAPTIEKILALTEGTGLNQFDREFFAERTIAISTNDDLDLSGVLVDAFGNVLTPVEIMLLLIIADTTNSNTLTIGAGSNPWIAPWIATGDGVKLGPGGVFLLMSPDASGIGAIIAGTGDILRIANGAGTTSKYKIAILGRSA